jgi:hypothetical protein
VRARQARNADTKDPDRVKISVQYRSKLGRVFELTERGHVLAVHITRRQGPEDAGEWHVETRLGTGTGPFLVEAWGATRAEALREVANAWSTHSPSLEALNWEAVTKALLAVDAV